MDPVQRNQSLFIQIDIDLSEFIEVFAKDPASAGASLERLLQTARIIGGSLLEDILALKRDFHVIPLHKDQVVADALRIKHEIKEL